MQPVYVNPNKRTPLVSLTSSFWPQESFWCFPLFSVISGAPCQSWALWPGTLSDKNISRTPPRADGLSAWLVTTHRLLQEAFWWTVSFWRRSSSVGRMIGDAEDALPAVWPVAGGNRRVWGGAVAGSDVCQSQSGHSRCTAAWMTEINGGENIQRNCFMPPPD